MMFYLSEDSNTLYKNDHFSSLIFLQGLMDQRNNKNTLAKCQLYLAGIYRVILLRCVFHSLSQDL